MVPSNLSSPLACRCSYISKNDSSTKTEVLPVASANKLKCGPSITTTISGVTDHPESWCYWCTIISLISPVQSVSILCIAGSVISNPSCQFLPLKPADLFLCSPRWITATLLVSLSKSLVDKLPKGLEQCCMYCLPLAKSRPCYTFLLCEIHWQPPQAHIDYKITPKCYCCLHSVTSAYLLQILQLPPPSVCLCCPPQMRNSANAASPAQILKLATTFSSNCVGIQIL